MVVDQVAINNYVYQKKKERKKNIKNVLDSIFKAVNISVLCFWYALPVAKMLYTEALHGWFAVKKKKKKAFCSRIWH